jgi:hypothetical protein
LQRPMWAMSDGPRIEDFGITEGDLERAPKLFLSHHRPLFLCVAYLVASVVVFSLIFSSSGSMAAAVFFTAITLAAGSVLLLPLLILLVCVGERTEERWLCYRFPLLRACLAYRAAVADHQRQLMTRQRNEADARWWVLQDPRDFSEQAARVMAEHGSIERPEGGREVCGFDFVVRSDAHTTLVRCETTSEPVDASVGREMAAALIDYVADDALIVTPGGASSVLVEYLHERPIKVVPPWKIKTAFRSS